MSDDLQEKKNQNMKKIHIWQFKMDFLERKLLYFD